MNLFADDATANILIRGLGLASFNRNLNRFEDGIIHDGNHKLMIVVTGLDDPMSDITGIELNEATISFTTTGTPETRGVQKHMGATFDRINYANNDMQDIRWLFHIARDLHDNALRPTPGGTSNKPSISRLYIENAYFTASMPPLGSWTRQPFFFKKLRPNGLPVPFGFMAETAVARMKTDEKVVATVTINGNSKDYEFPHHPNNPYRISIFNLDTSTTTTPNEIDILYKFIEDPAGTKYDLKGWREVEEKRADNGDSTTGATTGMEYCHLSEWGDGSIDDFYQ